VTVRRIPRPESASASAPPEASPSARPRRPTKTPHPGESWIVVCISTYPEDLAELDAKVEQLKARGHRKANRSALIRLALERFDIDDRESVTREWCR
jgi:hypothetical protein